MTLDPEDLPAPTPAPAPTSTAAAASGPDERKDDRSEPAGAEPSADPSPVGAPVADATNAQVPETAQVSADAGVADGALSAETEDGATHDSADVAAPSGEEADPEAREDEDKKEAPPSLSPTSPADRRASLPQKKTGPGLARGAALVVAMVVAGGLYAASLVSGPGGLATGTGNGVDGGDAEAPVASSAAPTAPGESAVGIALPSPKDPVAASTATPVWRVASLKDDPSVTYVEGAVGRKTLSGLLVKAGMPAREVPRLLKAFEGKKKLDKLRPKDTFAFAIQKEKGKIVGFELATSPEDVWQAREENDALTVKKLDLAVDRRKVAVGFAVTSELHEAITHAGLDDDAMKRLDDALDGHFELSDLRPGTRIRLVLTELRIEGKLARYAHVDAVEVRPPTGTAALRVYHFDEDDEGKEHGKEHGKERRHRDRPTGFFDAKGHQPYHGGYRSPVPGARISSRFNPTRMHPVLHVVMPHNGIDFAAPTGAKVYASSAGTVLLAGNGGPCGNMVQIEHQGGLVTAYCHLSKFAAGLHQGQRVDTRQLVGYVGATGRVTGPHLHFALKKDQKFIDPMTLKMDGVRVLPARDRDAFGRARSSLDAALDAVPLPAPTAAEGQVDAGAKEEELYDETEDTSDGGQAP